MQISFSTFEGIAVKLKDSGRFGVVQSIQGSTCTVALGTEDPEKGVVLPEQPAIATAVTPLPTDWQPTWPSDMCSWMCPNIHG